MEIKPLIIFCYLIMNIVGLLIMRIDKNRAIHHKYRISEKTLWLIAIYGGAVGSTIGMRMFRHKTKHLSFKIGFPVLAVLEILVFIGFLLKFFS